MNCWKSLIFLALLVAGCAEQGNNLGEVRFFKFHADWCEPCKRQEPIVKRLEMDFTSVTFHRVNTDQQAELARQHNVDNIPCIVITVGGIEKKRYVGVTGYEVLARELSKYSGTTR